MPIFSGITFAAATLMVAMRFWLRIRGHAGKLGLDDAILLPGWLASVMFTAVTMVYVTWAQGDRHIWDISPGKREPLALCLWLAEFAFLVCGGFTKVSVLLFYRRLVEGTYNKLWRWLVLFAIGFTVAYTIAFCVMLLINCTPTEAYWKAFDPVYATTQKYTCLDTKIINTLAGVFAAASDLYSVALPCIITWHFSVPRAQKIALNIIFCLGLLVVAASGVRTYYLMITGHDSDVSWNIFDLFLWAQLELQLGIMCAAAPSLRVFFRRYLGNSSASRAFKSGLSGGKSGGRATPGYGNTLTSVGGGDKSITVVRSTSVTVAEPGAYSSNRKQFDGSLDTVGESGSDDRSWSPTPSKERLTRYSHEEDPIALQDMAWRHPGRLRESGSRF